MSRLDSAIRRLQAQRACLDRAVDLAADIAGVAVEFGLGNGRTYDHLRERLGDRPLFVFDRQVASHPDSTPDPAHLILGELPDAIPVGAARLSDRIALCHIDIGRGVKAADEALAAAIAQAVAPFLAPGAVILGDQAVARADFTPLPLPDGIAPGRYHLYRFDD